MTKYCLQTRDGGLDYELIRSSRKTMSLEVGRSFVRIRAPLRLSLSYIEQYLHQKINWIRERQRRYQEQLSEASSYERGLWQHQGWVLYLNQKIRLVLDPNLSALFEYRVVGEADRQCHLNAPKETDSLYIRLPIDASEHEICQACEMWLQGRAQQYLSQYLKSYSRQKGIVYKRFALSKATKRWGSCSSDGTIRLNWRLIHFSPNLLEYVVAHELAHLEEMNHSPRFWACVQKLMPNYKDAHAEIMKIAILSDH